MADEEAAFLSSMQAANEAANEAAGYENGEGSEEQAESSSDEYDPTQAVQTDLHPPSNAQDPSVQASAHDVSLPDPTPSASAIPLTSISTSATILRNDTPQSDHQSLSRSMSRASSQSSEENFITGIQHLKKGTPSHTDGVGQMGQAGENSAADMEQKSSLHPVSDSSFNNSTNHVPADNVQMQNDVQAQNPSGLVQNGATNTVPNLAAVLPDTGASSHSESILKPSMTLPAPSMTEATSSTRAQPPTPSTSAPRARLPHDTIGILEDRIKEDPRGDLQAWLHLINEHKKRAKIDDARSVYERFLSVFPTAGEEWVSYAQMENEAQNRTAMDKILSRALPQNPYLPVWSMYLDHIRRHNNLTTDSSGQARQIIHQAYDVAMQYVGLDKDSGKLWVDYIQFIKSGPGIIGGSNWQDQQKMDLLRKIYQRAICIPTEKTNPLWKEYDGFEMGLNKMTGRKFLQDQSPAYMSARSSYTELQNITRNLRRTTLPVLPPTLGFQGDVEYMEQLDIWKRWIQWEKDDPLVLKQDDVAGYRARIIFVYKHALMAMRFWPELWCDASDFCFTNDMETEGDDFLTQGIAANPESCLLALKRADRLELSSANEEGDESAVRRGAAVREPYDKVLDAFYDLVSKSKSREAQDIVRIEANFVADGNTPPNDTTRDDDNDGVDADEEGSKERQKAAQIESVKNMHAVQISLLSKTLSHIWIALIRAMRRIQGKGKVNDAIAGLRGTFANARKRGRITSDVYVACALIEFHCYEVETGKKIFERGLKLFPEDEAFALEYIKHLVANNDHTNARVVFETTVAKLAQKPETVSKAKPLYAFFHDFEARYGELTQLVKLEKRMRDLYPEDPALVLFSRRFQEQGFDPTVIRPIISPATQTRPKTIPSIETEAPPQSPPSHLNTIIDSPKRPLPFDDSDPEGRPQKLARTVRDVSPLKGAAGRRLDQQKRSKQPADMPQFSQHQMQGPPPPPPLPRDITFLLSIIPKAETYHATKFDAASMVRLIRETNIPTSLAQAPLQPAARGPPPFQQGPPFQQMPPGLPMPHGQYNGQFNGQFNGVYPPFSFASALHATAQLQPLHARSLQYGRGPSEIASAQSLAPSFSPSQWIPLAANLSSERIAVNAPLRRSPNWPNPIREEVSAHIYDLEKQLEEIIRD